MNTNVQWASFTLAVILGAIVYNLSASLLLTFLIAMLMGVVGSRVSSYYRLREYKREMRQWVRDMLGEK